MRKILNIVLILILVLPAVVFLSSCSLNIEDARLSSGKNTIEVKNIDLDQEIFSADVYINRQFIQRYKIASAQTEKGILKEKGIFSKKNVKSSIQEYGMKEGFRFHGNMKLFVYTMSYALDTLEPNDRRIAVLGPGFIEIDGKMQLLDIDLPKDQFESMIGKYPVPEEDKKLLMEFFERINRWRDATNIEVIPGNST